MNCPKCNSKLVTSIATDKEFCSDEKNCGWSEWHDPKNVELKEGFTQVCVWEGTIIPDGQGPEDFEKFIMEALNSKAQYLESIVTTAGKGGEGGRTDLFFAVHSDDIGKFAVPRLGYGIRWIEDCLDNGNDEIWPARVKEYRTW